MKVHSTLDDLIKCITRDIDVDDENDYELFLWFWDDLMGKWPSARFYVANSFVSNHLAISPFHTGKVVGHDQWGVKQKHFTTMSEAKLSVGNSVSDKALFLPSTEAYAYIMLDNCSDKWEAMCKHYAAKGDWGKKLPKKVTKAARELAAKAAKDKENVDDDATTNGEDEKDDKDIDAIDQLHKARCSSPDEGQQKYGSFSRAGRDEHGRILKLVKKARKDAKDAATEKDPDACIQVELDFLKKHREADNIVGKNHAEQCKIKGRNRKRKAGEGVVLVEEDIGADEEVLDFGSDSDEE